MAHTKARVELKRMIIDDPNITTDELMVKLKKKFDPVPSRWTVSAIRQEFRHSLRLLKEEGLLIKSYKMD